MFADDKFAAEASCTAISGTNSTGSFPCSFTMAAGDPGEDGKPPICDCVACPSSFSPFVTVDGSLCATDTVKLISLIGAGKH